MPHGKDEPLTEPSLGKLRPLEPSLPTSAQAPPTPHLRLPTLASLEAEGPTPPPTALRRIRPLPSEARALRILDFDIENRPLSYLGGDWTTAEVTAIAAGWSDEEAVECWALGEVDGPTMLAAFRDLYERADVVTGHWITGHDLPILNGALMEHGLPTLGPKLTSDTKRDLIKRKDISASQESLAAMLELAEPKVGMNQARWREANRLTPAGIAATKERVIGDVNQHKALRLALLERNLLKPPRRWAP